MLVKPTSIPGLLLIELDVVSDDRGSFREVWQAEKMQALGLPHFQPVQQNISESKRGVIRGIHAEPWDKYIHIAAGTVFSAIVDLRQDQATFGKVELFELHSGNAIFVPKGLGNSFQATSELAVYSYLVTAHWQPGLAYTAVAFDDPDLSIPWPISGDRQLVSEKDRRNKSLREQYPSQFVS